MKRYAPVLVAIAALLGAPVAKSAFSNQCDEDAILSRAVLQYLPDQQQIVAWRELQNPDKSLCIKQDFPTSLSLTAAAATVLYNSMRALHDRSAEYLRPTQEIKITSADSPKTWRLSDLPPNAQSGPETNMAPGCAPRKPYAAQQFWRFADQDLSFSARLGPTTCNEGTLFAGAGTAVMLSPNFALTAAHIVTDPDGEVQCKYRLRPGGAAYSSAVAQPFGVAYTSSITLAPKAKQMMTHSPDQLSVQALSDYVANDYAFLHLKASEQVSTANAMGSANLWPAFEFSPRRGPNLPQVYKSGYPMDAPARTLRSPGASLSADGAAACAKSARVSAFSLLTFHGDSGAPIWIHPDHHPMRWLSVVSLVSVGESNHAEAAFTFGPRFSMSLYRQILKQLKQRSVTQRH